MSKVSTEELSLIGDNDDDADIVPLPFGSKNYITPGGHARLMDEFYWLMNTERPEITASVAWAAGNGDRSENGDYIYGKKRLREIDRRIRFLTKRLDTAEIIDPTIPREDKTRIFFGATVTFINQSSIEKTVSIVGIDEIEPSKGYISWISPVARALMTAQQGDMVTLKTPGGINELSITVVKYQNIPIELFKPVSLR
ncbi:transcription elongation factor GreB [Nitrosomonas cryotolerans]|uniref:Transcription elongation factor GreB n=1 Tax=Nitrosomonas cryotolerans ATCC 49181 TaxID=1131553 RepID=A0A1N6IRZ4_9PROT|nr:transcription elongation factor GreB [Nitrosomonas cryotolerans]SFP33599.1 transcription elongation factor GreB [Nitrosomonas cryotolerans]SIO34802.1 transcription elongation factor GreB [Nitrosomonas cryotolerans ATCC 49181]